MKAAQYTAPGQVELVDIPMPVPTAEQVLIQMTKLTVCGSDVHALYGSPVSDYPFAPGMTGHECVGVVVESAFPAVKPGVPMLVIPPQTNALAEYIAVEPQWLIPLPAGLGAELGVLAQQLGTVIYCCKKIENVLDKTVVIIGQGPAGLLFTMLLSRMGAKQVIGLDIVEHRLTMARRFGANHTANVEEVDPIEAIRELTAETMVDLVVEAVGKDETINLAPDLVRSQGELVLFGVPKNVIFPFTYENFFRKQLRTYSSAYTQLEPGFRSFRLALDWIAQGRLDVAPIITHRMPVRKIQEAFHLAETRADGAVKVLVDFAA